MGYFRLRGDSVMVRPKEIVYRNGQWKDTVRCDRPEGLMYDFSAQLDDTLQCRINYPLGSYEASTESWSIGSQQRVFEGVSREVLNMNFRPYTNFPSIIWPMNWTRGIGSDIHPFYSLACMGDHCEIEQQTTRVWLNDTLIYRDTLLRFTLPCNSWVSNDPVEKIGIDLYPNPTKSAVTLRIEGVGESRFSGTVFDVFGKKHKALLLKVGENRISLDELSPGMYLIRFEVGGKQYAEKLVLE
ncbi:MAG: T9SS type A sorting domain-containing protein [Bacteroidia bacterium]